MSDVRHLIFSVPDDWSNDDKGDFYEEFIVEILKPMRLSSERRLRVTGMELDILAKGEDQPINILVECKAHRDAISADVITKLMGNVQIRKADRGWLFTTSDLTKDGRGLWQEIQNDPEHARKFTWYSPSKTIDVLISQRSIVHPVSLAGGLAGWDLGDWSLIVTPGKRSWLVELLEDGLPAKYCVFDARAGSPLGLRESQVVAEASARFSALQVIQAADVPNAKQLAPVVRAPVAKVISGDTWEDPRPARPIDFVGRDDVIKSISSFIGQVRQGETSTRSFAVQAPSGWGKSSLTLKLVQSAASGAIERCSVTAIDSRSANTAAFVAEALRLTLKEALGSVAGKKNSLKINSLREPLDSQDVKTALAQLKAESRVAVLLFDQFEELFAKEALFEVFNAVRDLSLDIDAAQAPLILGFAWKTDVSLPQQHPAYHLWHQLADRRRSFKVGEFKRGEIIRVVSKAEKAIGKTLSRVLRSRLAEQCQGLPWLLKKLLVHVLQRVSTPESQYLLLERELDIEQLFKEDLEQLQEEHIRCLRFVAAKAPITVAEVEESFSREATNLLINQHLLVRSGMNYVIYWDIFRDYLVDEKVPQIPWTRTFQRTPPVALKAVRALNDYGPLSAGGLGVHLELKEGPTFNLLGDLVALQLVDADGSGNYRVASHLGDISADTLASVVRRQLQRHVVARAIERAWGKEKVFPYDEWLSFFDRQQPRSAPLSQTTLRQYAGNLKSWLLFAGLVDISANGLARADGRGSQMGRTSNNRATFGFFFGTSSPKSLEGVLRLIFENSRLDRARLDGKGFRKAISDLLTLGIIEMDGNHICLERDWTSFEELLSNCKKIVRAQSTIKLAAKVLVEAGGDRLVAGDLLRKHLGASWKDSSAKRNVSGLARYIQWSALEKFQSEQRGEPESVPLF
ncbi:restriction endonuclease [Lysobacter capsici]|uniref:nSTAND1 domain-containing NTPase n=1 Tax=Lysobacter capsici TaxID=435897 RepID=UPI001C008FAC|nr:restriction endonuclease [Lysobacter capsici]QWF16388.1 restriction endonuclease [Lysobacter capsici]